MGESQELISDPGRALEEADVVCLLARADQSEVAPSVGAVDHALNELAGGRVERGLVQVPGRLDEEGRSGQVPTNTWSRWPNPAVTVDWARSTRSSKVTQDLAWPPPTISRSAMTCRSGSARGSARPDAYLREDPAAIAYIASDSLVQASAGVVEWDTK